MRRPIHLKRVVAFTLPILMILAIVWPVSAQDAGPNYTSPYSIASKCEFINGVGGNPRSCVGQNSKEACEKYSCCYWRDTTNQNALAERSDTQFTGQVYQVYTDSSLTVLDYASAYASHIIAIMSSGHMYLVGAGGGRNEALAAKTALQAAFPAITGKHLIGVVYPSADPEVTWGGSYWRSAFPSVPPAPVFASSEYDSALQWRQAVAPELTIRDLSVLGTQMTDGSDEFIGLGYGRDWAQVQAGYVPPTISISENTTLYLDAVPINLSSSLFSSTATNRVAALPEIAGLNVYIPGPKILIPYDLFGDYLPNLAPLNGRTLPINEVMSVLADYLALADGPGIDYMIPLHGHHVSGAVDVRSVLQAQYDALTSIRNRTLEKMQAHVPLNDIVTQVKLPANLSASPYAQEYVARVEHIVRAVYHEYAGWWDGNVSSLPTLSSYAHAQRLIQMAGGEKGALNYAQKCLTDHTRDGLAMSVEVLTALRQVYPSQQADTLYIEALKILGFSEPSAMLRNAYLVEAFRARIPQFVVSAPSPGDSFAEGDVITIRWTPGNVTGNVNIWLTTTDMDFTIPISLNTANDGVETWTVTQDVITVSTSKARIEVVSVSQPNISGVGGQFNIVIVP